MISNESLWYYLSVEYKIYTLCGNQKKSLDKKIFRTKLRSFFYTKPSKYITFNKSSTRNPLGSDFCGQNT
jgi:hypothetical protein